MLLHPGVRPATAHKSAISTVVNKLTANLRLEFGFAKCTGNEGLRPEQAGGG